MATYKASEGQTLRDIAIMATGSAKSEFEIARLNGISVTDALTPGQIIEVTDVVEPGIKQYYDNKAISPATEFVDDEETFDRIFGDEFGEEFE